VSVFLLNALLMDLLGAYASDEELSIHSLNEDDETKPDKGPVGVNTDTKPDKNAEMVNRMNSNVPACTEENINNAKSATAIMQMIRKANDIKVKLSFQVKTKALLGIAAKSTLKTRAEWKTHKIIKDLLAEVKGDIHAIETLEDVYKLDELSVAEGIHAMGRLMREPTKAIAIKIFNLGEAVDGNNPLRTKTVEYLAYASKSPAVCEEALRRRKCDVSMIAQVAPKDLMPLLQEKMKNAKIDGSAEELAAIVRRMPHPFIASTDSNSLLEAVIRKRPDLEKLNLWDGLQQMMEKQRRKDFDSLVPEIRANTTTHKRSSRGEMNTVQLFHVQEGHSKRHRGNKDFERPSPARKCADKKGSSY